MIDLLREAVDGLPEEDSAMRAHTMGRLAFSLGWAVAPDARATWEAAFGALDLAGLPVSLIGRSLRVPGADPAAVGRLLAEAGVQAEVVSVPASFEETFVTLAS